MVHACNLEVSQRFVVQMARRACHCHNWFPIMGRCLTGNSAMVLSSKDRPTPPNSCERFRGRVFKRNIKCPNAHSPSLWLLWLPSWRLVVCQPQALHKPNPNSPVLKSAAVAANPGSASIAVDDPKPLSAEELKELVSGVAIDPEDNSLSAEEMEVLVARIALYPDELIAVITAASLYPLQIVEAQRFLDDSKTNKSLKPKPTWDGSVVSLLNYPEIVRMMSDDLEWTQRLGEAIVNQQQDVIAAIQQLREKAVAEGIIKTDDKMKVVEENDNIIIQPASTEVIYIPQYQPEMLYEEDYIYRPVAYYPDPYPYYYSPIAPFFAGVVTGAIWVGIVDSDDGFRGGHWGRDWGNDIYIDCNNCFNNRQFKGRLAINDVDWKNVDRRKIRFDRGQLDKIDRSTFKYDIKKNDRNRIGRKAKKDWGNQNSTRSGQETGAARCSGNHAQRPEEANSSEVGRQGVRIWRGFWIHAGDASKTCNRQETATRKD